MNTESQSQTKNISISLLEISTTNSEQDNFQQKFVAARRPAEYPIRTELVVQLYFLPCLLV